MRRRPAQWVFCALLFVPTARAASTSAGPTGREPGTLPATTAGSTDDLSRVEPPDCSEARVTRFRAVTDVAAGVAVGCRGADGTAHAVVATPACGAHEVALESETLPHDVWLAAWSSDGHGNEVVFLAGYVAAGVEIRPVSASGCDLRPVVDEHGDPVVLPAVASATGWFGLSCERTVEDGLVVTSRHVVPDGSPPGSTGNETTTRWRIADGRLEPLEPPTTDVVITPDMIGHGGDQGRGVVPSPAEGDTSDLVVWGTCARPT